MKKPSYYAVLACFLLMMFIAVPVCASSEGERTLILPAEVKVIEKEAFYGVQGIDKVVIPEGATEIQSLAFVGCSLTEVVLPASLTYIATDAFDVDAGMTVLVSENCYAYDRCVELGLIVEAELEPTPEEYFTYEVIDDTYCRVTGYTGTSMRVMIPKTLDGYVVQEIGARAFQYCTSLTDIIIPNEVTLIGQSAFDRCENLTNVELPSSLQTIKEYAFRDCTKLSEIYLPDSITTLAGGAFSGCENLVEVNYPISWTEVTDNYYSGFKFSPFKNTALSIINVPEGVTSIPAYAFQDCKTLVNIAFPSTLTVIKERAFYNCTNLTNVIFPDSLREIYSCAFDNCEKLQYVEFPYGLEILGENAFSYCGLTSVELGPNIKTINNSFANCDDLVSVKISNGTTFISASAFSNCTSLERIYIPTSVTSIYDKRAFFNTSPTLAIYGEPGSYAETYAKDNNIQFRAGMPIQTSLIKGYVRLTDGTPLANATVSITLADSTAVVRTDASGSWQYLCEPYERYTVSYAADGYTISPAQEYVETDKSNIFLGTVYASTDADDLALTAPVFAAPSQDEVIFGSEVNVIWNTQMAAGAYRVAVTETIEGSAGEPVVSIVKTNSISIPVATGVSYQVTVTALANESDSDGVSSTVSFSGAAASAMPVVTGFKFSSESVLTGAPVDFTIQADNASFVQLIVDGIGYETRAVVDGTATLTREFTLAGNRQISFRAFGNGVWGEACEHLTLQVSAEADLSPAVISCEEKVWVNTDVTVSWEPVDHATGYVIYLTDALGNIFDWEYKSDLLTSITINAEYFVEPGSYQILVMAYGSGYSQSSARVDFVVTDEYIPWSGWVQHSTVNTYTSSACSTINGFVDYLDPVTVLGEENDAYLIEMKLSSGEYAQRYVFKMNVGTKQYTPDLTLQGSFSMSGDSIILRATTNLPGLRAGVSLNGKELGSSAYPQRTENYTKTFIFSLSAPETETEYVIWAEDAQSVRVEKSIVVPARDVNTPEPSVSPESTVAPEETIAPEETTVPEVAVTPSPFPKEEDDAVQLPSQPAMTPKPTACSYMSNGSHLVAVNELEYMQLLCGSDGKLRMLAAVCERCGTVVTGDIPETINMQFYFHPILRYYDTSGNDKSYCMNSKYTSITCNAPLDVTKNLHLNGGTLYVQGKLTVSGKITGVSQINCSELEIKNGGEIAMTKDGSIRVSGGITINGTLSGASSVDCGKRFYVGSKGIMAFDPVFTLEAGGRFEFYSNYDHANYMGGDSHITAAGMKIRGKCFQFDGTFYTTSSDLDMNNREGNYVELLDLSALGGLVDFDGKKLTNSAPKEYQVCAHNYYYIEMTDSAAEAVAQVLDGIYDEESRSLIEPQMRNGEPDESYYADKIDEQIDEEYGMTPPQYTITASTVPKKHRDAAIEIINRALEDVDIDPMVIESRGIISIGSIQYDLRTYDETVSLKDDNNRSWNVNFKGIKSILNSKVSVFSSDVEMFSGQISCAALNINSQPFTVTSTKEDLQSAAQNIVAIGETEIQKIKNDLLKSVINDALKMIAIQGSLAGTDWLSMTDCITYAHEITSLSVANDLFSFLDEYTEYYSWFTEYQEVAENVLAYH